MAEREFEASSRGRVARKQALWLVWYALFLGTLTMVGAAALVSTRLEGASPEPGPGGGSPEASPVAGILGAAALVLIGLSFVVPLVLPRASPRRNRGVGTKPEESLDARAGRHLRAFQVRMIISASFSEAGALAAAIGMLVAGFVPLLVAACALFPVSMLVLAPTTPRVSGFLRDRLADEGRSSAQVEAWIARWES